LDRVANFGVGVPSSQAVGRWLTFSAFVKACPCECRSDWDLADKLAIPRDPADLRKHPLGRDGEIRMFAAESDSEWEQVPSVMCDLLDERFPADGQRLIGAKVEEEARGEDPVGEREGDVLEQLLMNFDVQLPVREKVMDVAARFRKGPVPTVVGHLVDSVSPFDGNGVGEGLQEDVQLASEWLLVLAPTVETLRALSVVADVTTQRFVVDAIGADIFLRDVVEPPLPLLHLPVLRESHGPSR
jgi:hypothetical protein